MKYKRFKLEDLFCITGTKPLDAGSLKFENKGINFIGRTNENNGIQGKICLQEFEPNEPHTITATVIGNYKYVKYQDEPYYTSQNINKLIPRYKWDKHAMLYLVAHIQKFVSKYNGQQGGYKLKDIKNHEIELPVNKNGLINADVMSITIRSKEKKQFNLVSEFMEDSGLLNDAEAKFCNQDKLTMSKHSKLNKMEISVGDLFEIKSTKKIFNAKDVKIYKTGNPYVVRMGINNGIRGYLREDTQFLNEGNTLSFGQDTATIFYQKEPYFTGDKIKILIPKFDNFNNYIALYILATMRKAFSTFSWGTTSFNVNIIKNIKISVPQDIKTKTPDFDFMETYIKTIKKNYFRNIKGNIKTK